MAQPQPQPQPQLAPHIAPRMSPMPQISPMPMPMPQMPHMAPRPSYSPPQQQQQHSISPASTPQPTFAIPPNKRPRMSPGPQSQPQSPYPGSPYAMSPQLSSAQAPTPAAAPTLAPAPSPPPATTTASPSPNYSNVPASTPNQQTYAPTSYTNGNAAPLPSPTTASIPMPLPTPSLHLPEVRPALPRTPSAPSTPTQQHQPHPQQQQNSQQHPQQQHQYHQQQPQQPQQQPVQQQQQQQPAQQQQQQQQPHQQHQYTTAVMAPIGPPPPPTPVVMGPPSKPVERPTKEYEYDVSDSLAGTGIDLRAEEQALADYYAGTFAQEARTGAPANAPGSKGSFYGAGWANQTAEPIDAESQEKHAAEMAKKAWDEAAQRLATMRANEIRDPFLLLAVVHRKAEKMAKEHGIGLNLDLKTSSSLVGRMKQPHEFPQPKVTVSAKVGPDGTMVSTSGSWIPHDAYLADQLSLLSIATKHRIRELLEDANSIAITRQKTACGEVPEQWVDVAVPLNPAVESIRDGSESAVSPLTNPLKRSFETLSAQDSFTDGKAGIKNHLTMAVRDAAKLDRQIEEARLKKRQKRMNPETATAGSRAGSVAPGTPGGGAAPEESKAPSKKELKKGMVAARLAEASSTASANQTLNTLMGGFGGRKKGKQYSWMTAGGSGASTPSRMNSQDSAAVSVLPGGAKPVENTSLTQEGTKRLGTWREDSNKGQNIQLRDWVTVLEMDGADPRALQSAYMKLDSSQPK
ncbi:hypothetical protein B0T19DRAFT_247595 [Cercophora scortea]|uniref:Transcription initiation factor TFIID subunit 4 n=1 Tax=Cercophora scortea TaxID=314031 RepID=A0AAE0M671_9PEZI|nr:hypothetical protein B0T19DRAFT_247595 [Cercophora scortea]